MMRGTVAKWLVSGAVLLASPALAQNFELNDKGYFHAPGADVMVFSNWYDGLFADSKISGVEIVLQDLRLATNGDVRLSATPGQWDPIGAMVKRSVDPATGAVDVLLEYKDQGFQYRIHAERAGGSIKVSVILDKPVPAALAGKAGFNLEFLPAAYFHHAWLADGAPGSFPLHPASDMIAGGERNAASGRDVGPGAEPLPMAMAKSFVLAPEDPARRVTVTSPDWIGLYDGRNQAQNGWFVLRSTLPPGKAGRVLEWTITPNSDPAYVRKPVIGHSQLGYAPEQNKVAVIEVDMHAIAGGEARVLRIAPDGTTKVVAEAAPRPWGQYLRYGYSTFDFSGVREPGLYMLEYGGTRTAPFRIAPDVYADAWHATNDVYMPVAMDHMLVNEAYRVWHGDPHRDDAKQAPVNHEHIDLYAQGPTTDTAFKPGEHIPGLAVGGWLDAGDFDLRTQTNYGVVRELVSIWEEFGGPKRDQLWIDEASRHAEIHVPDGKPDIQQQIEHGVLQLVAQFDAVGHAINGIVEPDVAQYTHLGDAASKTDGVPGTDDDRWAFTSKSSALNYGSIAALAAASRALRGHDDKLADKALGIASRVWAEEQTHDPDLFRHGNTTGGPLEAEQFGAAVELLVTTQDPKYAAQVQALWPGISKFFGFQAATAIRAIPFMPASYREQVKAAAQALLAQGEKFRSANPYGVPITEGGWAGNGAVVGSGLTDYAIHKAFPELSNGTGVFRALDYLHGTHPGSDISFVSGVGTVSKEVAYGSNRADFSFIAGGVVPGVLILKPDLPENSEIWPFFWGENEYVVNLGPSYIALVLAAQDLLRERRGR